MNIIELAPRAERFLNKLDLMILILKIDKWSKVHGKS